MLGVSLALNRDACGGGFDFVEIRRRKLDVRGRHVFLHARELCRSRNGDDPGLARQEPRESNLRGCGMLLSRNSCEKIDECLVGLEILGSKTWQTASEIRAVELCVRCQAAGQESPSQRA